MNDLRPFKIVCGPVGTIDMTNMFKSFEDALARAMVCDFETEEKKEAHEPIYVPQKPSWKQDRLRRGQGHNKHSRKGKKK